jgi:uncharacterized membrane protein
MVAVVSTRNGGRIALAVFFMVAGTLHFLFPAPYLRIMPPVLPWPKALVGISGAAEILGGLGLLNSQWRRSAAWGLVLLLLAVFPANIYMAVAHIRFPGWLGQPWFQWLRLPLQFVLIAGVLHYSRPPAQFRTEVISLNWQPDRKSGFPWGRS